MAKGNIKTTGLEEWILYDSPYLESSLTWQVLKQNRKKIELWMKKIELWVKKRGSMSLGPILSLSE